MSSNLSSSFHQFNFEVAKPNGHCIYVFDGFRLDGDKMLLYKGELPTALPPKAVETLSVLVRSRGEIVSKEELIEAVWRDTVVEESNLTQYLYLIRKTLGTRPDGRPYIETLRKRGYVFASDTFASETRHETGVYGSEPATADNGTVLPFTPRATEMSAAVPSGVPITPRRRIALVAVSQAALLGVVIAAVAWFNSGAADASEDRVQTDMLRLTDAIEVAEAVISPNGEYFAYSEIDGERSRMWLQHTGQSNRQEVLPWSDKWIGPKTFSPDSQFIYYVEADPAVDNTLYRISAFGGPPSKVLSGIHGPVSFSRSGNQFIYYRYLKTEKVSQIVKRETGGSESVVFSWKDDYPDTNVAWSPTGTSIAFSSRSLRDLGGNTTVYKIDLEDPKPEPISQERWEAIYRIVWRPDGRGLYSIATKEGDGYTTRRDQLYFISFPAGRSRRVTVDGNRHQVSSLSVTVDNKILLVPYNRISQVFAMDASGDSRTAIQLTKGLADGRSGIAPLYDGRVAYISRNGENLAVWTVQPDGSDPRQLTTEPQLMEELRSGGGGRNLYFSVPEGRHNDLYSVNADGSGLRQVTSGPRVIDSDISNDGKWMVYSGAIISGLSIEIGLWKAPIDGGEPTRFAIKGCDMPHFSPDDKYISCVEDQSRVKVLSSADGTQIQSFNLPPRSTVNFGVRWSPDGRSLVYIVEEKDVSNLWLQPIDGSAPKRLTDFTAGSIYHFVYSLDGKRLYLARGTQIRDAVLISNKTD